MKTHNRSRAAQTSAPYSASRARTASIPSHALIQPDRLQRTYGNAALARANDAPPIDPGLWGQTVQSIIQRSMLGASGVSPKIAQRTQTPVVQRLMSGTTFESNILSVVASTSQSYLELAKFDIVKYLDFYHTHSARMPEQKKLEFLKAIHARASHWVGSSHKLDVAPKTPAPLNPGTEKVTENPAMGKVMELLGEITAEVRTLKASLGSKATSPGKSSTTSPGSSGSAHTAPVITGGAVEAEPLATGKETPEQLEAIKIVSGAKLTPWQKQHAEEMIRNPEYIQQGAFGVCGLTSILYSIASSNPKHFATVIREAWAVEHFVKEWMPIFTRNADFKQISVGAEVEYIAAQYLLRRAVGQSQPVEQHVVDAGGKTASKADNYGFVYDKQLKFSNTFEIEGWENTFGHFALTTGAMSYILNALGTGKPSYKIKRNSFGADFATAKSKAGKGYVLASVTNSKFYEDGKNTPIDKPFTPEARPEVGRFQTPKFVHWVTIKSAVLNGDYYALEIWTWGATYKATLHKDVIGTHIYSMIAAEADTPITK